MTGTAIYRFPGHRERLVVSGRAVTLPTIADIAGTQAFVIAPFDTSVHPIVAILPDCRTDCGFEISPSPNSETASSEAAYHADFQRAITLLQAGMLQKIVLARSVVEPRSDADPLTMFDRACQLYPDAFVTLFSTPLTGTWLVATPELLLSRNGDRWHTMALAGTRPHGTPGPWSDKNRHEQRLVDSYIADILGKYSSDIVVNGPVTVTAGAIDHLRTDFDFAIDPADFGTLLADLHPTPAVCGLPKDSALDEITHYHHLDRQYYSGFCGPVGIDGDTRLYVSLRCMRIDPSSCTLYAGGGLLPQSDYAAELSETTSKMQTIRKVKNEKIDMST